LSKLLFKVVKPITAEMY